MTSFLFFFPIPPPTLASPGSLRILWPWQPLGSWRPGCLVAGWSPIGAAAPEMNAAGEKPD